MTAPATPDLLVVELERMRARLLDLSAKNPLLNYRHPRARSLRVVDAVPAVVLDRLLTNGGFKFAALPDVPLFGEDDDPESADPFSAQDVDARARREAAASARARRETARANVAAQAGINPSFDLSAIPDLPDGTSFDGHLQTLLTDDELEARLQKIQATAVTAIQETGANMLHLLMGGVEWAEADGSATRMAPLILLPVHLTRLALDPKTHTFPYHVAASGEDWDTNLTLQEKCRREFGFDLPSIEADENLEAYFTRIESVLAVATKGWRVRRQVTLGLVSFGKMLMWRDLDGATWPAARPLLGNPLLREVLGEEPTPDFVPVAEMITTDYNIDKIDPAYGSVPPLVVLADSSQHSALVDVQRGRNLVLVGPPGTGKSQCITNVIADALAARKRVLFVAEKKVALDVVYRRLSDAGLGHFCLALHSHTSNKRGFLDALKARLDLSVPQEAPAALAALELQLTDTRETLTAHVDRMHAPFGSLGDTAFTIFWRVRRLAGGFPAAALELVREVSYLDALTVTPPELARVRALAGALSATAQAVHADHAGAAPHPWQGLTRVDLSFDSTQTVVASVRALAAALSAAESLRRQMEQVTDGATWPNDRPSLERLATQCEALLPPAVDVPSAVITNLHARADVAAVRAALAAVDLSRTRWQAVVGPWGTPGAADRRTVAQHRSTLARAIETVGATCTVEEITTWNGAMDTAAEYLLAVHTLTTAQRPAAFLSTGAAWRLVTVAQLAGRLPAGALELRSPVLSTADAGDRVSALAAQADRLRHAEAELETRFPSAHRVSTPELREMAGALTDAPAFLPGLFSGAYRRAVARYRRMRAGTKESRATMTQDVHRLLTHLVSVTTFAQEPDLDQFFGAVARGIHSPFAALGSVMTWAREAVVSFRNLGDDGRALAQAVWQDSPDTWRAAADATESHPAALKAAFALPLALSDIARQIHDDARGWEAESPVVLIGRMRAWRDLARSVIGIATSAEAPGTSSVDALLGRIAALESAFAADVAVQTHTATFAALDLPMPAAGAVADDALAVMRGALEYVRQFDAMNLPAPVVMALTSGPMAERVATLKAVGPPLAAVMAAVGTAEQHFVSSGTVDLAQWYASSMPDRVSLRDQHQRCERALAAERLLPAMAVYLRARGAVAASPAAILNTVLDADVLPLTQLPEVVDYLVARTLAEHVLRQMPALDQFSGAVHDVLRADFVRFDTEFLTLTQAAIACSAASIPPVPGVGWGPVKDLSERALILHEIEKTRRHVPIREMFRRAGRAIQALKPCVMMGPQAVAQFLPPGRFQFDLIVMDEASQMRPEDALGAIARGTQLVVVGDPKQLGPTSFFDLQSSDDEDEVEETAARLATEAAGEPDAVRGASVLERSESILLAAARRYPTRMLRWHYRSRYPQLIRFSNAEFYNNELVLFPHPGVERERDGVNFRAVTNALYASNMNAVEAGAVVEAVRTHATEHPVRTLLVVTMNQKQRELIDGLLQRAEKDDPALVAFRARHEHTLEPLMVRNLENVQGDERDVILVSVTYGPNSAGVLHQGFGPINASGGERRLNVLFTRAKYRLDVFCSFDPTTLRVTEESPRGLVVLRDYLRFAKEGTLDGGRFTGKEPDSDFEIEVARALRTQGFDVHPQVGVAGYFLDMAVVDPQKPGRYAMAIECDGATYHSARSCRDRDRLRQGVLEGLGWTVHRIWSTDWFRDPRGETARIVRRLEAVGAVAVP